MIDKIKKGLFEWLKTFSSQPSFFSAKRIERFAFISTSIGAVITCIIYEVVKDKLTAAEVTILITPLLLAAGYNLNKTEQAKKDGTDGQV